MYPIKRFQTKRWKICAVVANATCASVCLSLCPPRLITFLPACLPARLPVIVVDVNVLTATKCHVIDYAMKYCHEYEL